MKTVGNLRVKSNGDGPRVGLRILNGNTGVALCILNYHICIVNNLLLVVVLGE